MVGMQTQIEAKFLAVNHEETRLRLAGLMASHVEPKRKMRCAILDFPDERLEIKENGWVRVRDEGNRITLTYKEVIEQRRGGSKQIEILVNSFDQAIELMEKTGLKVFSVQESRRETWEMGTVRVMLDEWPWIKQYIQIEGGSEAAVRDVAARLGFAWSQAVFGSSTIAYAAEFPGIRLDRESIAQIPEIRFGAPLPTWLKDRKEA